MKLNRSQWLALVFAIALAVWLGSGQFGTPSAEGEAAVELAPKPKALQRVLVRTLRAAPVTREVVIHGHTEPARRVTLSAETEGRVVAVAAQRGADVAADEVVARIDPRTRRDALSRAEALLHQRELEYRAAKQLRKKELRSEGQLAEALTALEAAQAELRAIQLDIRHLEIRAPFAGRLEARPVEVGDYLQVADPVAELVELSPLIVTGQVTEQEVGRLRRGLAGRARLVTGQRAEGPLRYVASTADDETRTFTVELELANEDHALAAGVTAVVAVEVERLAAHYVSAALLSLSDDGELGVKAVDGEGTVVFHPAEIVRSDSGGVWLAGLPEEVRLIVVGQGFVSAGQRVEAVEKTEGEPSNPSREGTARAPSLPAALFNKGSGGAIA